MKKTTWKKIMSLVLAVALIIGAMQFNAKTVSAAGVEKPTATITVDTSKPLEPEVEFFVKATGTDQMGTTTKTDVVLVLDLSSSMNENGKLSAVKSAASDFCSKLLGIDAAEGVIKVAIAGYGG